MKKIIDKFALGLLFVAVMYGANIAFFLLGYKNFFLDSFFIAAVSFFLFSKRYFLSLVIFVFGACLFLYYIFYSQRIAYSSYRFWIDIINIFNVMLVGYLFLNNLHKKVHRNINLAPVFLLVLFAIEASLFIVYSYNQNLSYPLINILNSNIREVVREVSNIYNIASLKNSFVFQILVILSLVLHVIFQILYILIALHVGIAFSKNNSLMLNYKQESFNNNVFKAYNIVFLFFVVLYLSFNRVPFLTAMIGDKNILIFQIFALASFGLYGIIGFNYISKSWLKNNILLLISFVVILFIFTIYAFLFIILLGFFISWRIYLAKEF